MCNYYFPRTLVGIFQALCSQPKFAPVSLGREMLATSREQSSQRLPAINRRSHNRESGRRPSGGTVLLVVDVEQEGHSSGEACKFEGHSSGEACHSDFATSGPEWQIFASGGGSGREQPDGVQADGHRRGEA